MITVVRRQVMSRCRVLEILQMFLQSRLNTPTKRATPKEHKSVATNAVNVSLVPAENYLHTRAQLYHLRAIKDAVYTNKAMFESPTLRHGT